MGDTREKSEFEKFAERYEQEKKLTAVELAETMLEYSKKLKELQDLEATIKRTVLDLGKTQTVGDIRATYSKGRRSCDYAQAACAAMESDPDLERYISQYRKITYDYRKFCSVNNIDTSDYFKETAGPSVSIKTIK